MPSLTHTQGESDQRHGRVLTGGWLFDAEPREALPRDLDLIISIRDSSKDLPVTEYLSMLWVDGSFVTVGLPDAHLPESNAFDLLPNGIPDCIGSEVEAAVAHNQQGSEGLD